MVWLWDLGAIWGYFGAIWEDFGEIVGKWVRLRRNYLCCARYDIMYFRGGVSKRGLERGAREVGGGAKKRDLKIGQKFCVWIPVMSRWGVRFF